jgi:hypothetical protein
LKHEEGGTDQETLEEVPLGEDLLERRPESISDGGAVVLQLNVDGVDFLDDIGVVGRESGDRGS